MIREGSCQNSRCGRCCSEDELHKFPLLMGSNLIDGKQYCKFLYFVDKKAVCKIFEAIEKIMDYTKDYDFNTWFKDSITSDIDTKMLLNTFITQAEWTWIRENCIGYPDPENESYLPPIYNLYPECSFKLV